MKVALLTSAVALVAGQPFPFNLPPPPLSSACRTRYDYDAQCCVDPAAREFRRGCAGLADQFGVAALRATCCPSQTECCPTEAYFDERTDTLKRNPSFTCCDSSKGKSCNLDVATGKGVCEDTDALTPFTPLNTWVEKLDGDGRCSTDGSVPLEIRPGQAFRCSVNVLLPVEASCPSDAVCAKDRQANANTGVCCRQTSCANYTTCTDCVTPLTKAERDALTSDEERTTQFVCSWLTQGDRYISKPRCVSSCRNFPEKSCIVGGLSSRGPDLCPRSNTNVNGTDYNTGTCERRCGTTGTGRSSRINNNGNFATNATKPAGHETTKCCSENTGDYCCDPWKGLAQHCTAGYVRDGPQCGVPMRGSPNNFFNTAPYAPPPYFPPSFTLWGSLPYGRPQLRPPQFRPPYNGFNNGFNGGGVYGGGVYGGFNGFNGGGFGGGFGGVYGGGFNGFNNFNGGFNGGFGGFGGIYGRREITEKFEGEKQAFGTPFLVGANFGNFGNGNNNFGRYPRPPPVPFWGYVDQEELPVPSDQFPSDFICSCDTICTNYDDCCSDYISLCIAPVVVVAAP